MAQKSWFKKLLTTTLFLSVFGLSAGLGGISVVVFQVFFGDDTELRKETILSRIKEETTLYYLDESTRIGSLFESTHRQYIPIKDIPAHMQNALIASEDKNFYQHIGIDPVAIATAVVEAVVTGRLRRGGSTITQQTVKNIMNDWEASLSRKFREMIKAFQLERLYSKPEILEFYLNQFHVAGNGNGVGIAAKYYFNKDVRDLTLVEAAFVAGSVKGPSKYNPFIKYTAETKKRAIKNANQRKDYVIRRMLEQGWISEEEYELAKSQEVPFSRGEFRNSEMSLVDLVKRQLKKKEVLQALNIKSADDLNVAGFRVYTTLDRDFQRVAQLAMRRNLSRLESILSGFQAEPLENFKPLRRLKVGEFYYGKVEEITGKGKKDDTGLKISFGYPMGDVSPESVIRQAKLLNYAVPKPGGYMHYVKQLRKDIKVGDVLYLEVVEADEENNVYKLEFQKRPVISGGLISLDKGEVRAVVSGFDTLGYNRAAHATRQPGSVFKAVVYFAAMQLGWSILDKVDNARQIFDYQGQFYYPRPDHASPYSDVSVLWSGVMSENLASVALTARLTEKLTFDQFKDLMGSMELLPEENEKPNDYQYRVGRATGISLSRLGVRKTQLRNSINDIATDLMFAGEQRLLKKLKKMWWGTGYLTEIENLRKFDPEEISVREVTRRVRLVKNNFLRYSSFSDALDYDWDLVAGKVEEKGVEEALLDPEVLTSMANFRVLASRGNRPALGYFGEENKEDQEGMVENEQLALLNREIGARPGRPLNSLDVQAIWGKQGLLAQIGSAGISKKDVKLDGFLSKEFFARIQNIVNERTDRILDTSDPYRLKWYYQHYDFRIALGLNYLVNLSKSMGVYSTLDPILSFSLGTNVVTAGEVAKVYQTFIEGKTYKFFEEGPENQTTFIRRIEDRFGNVVYEPKMQVNQLVSSKYADQMREILRKVVTHGTGRRARGELFVDLELLSEGVKEENKTEGGKKAIKVRVPSFGKTGTTNDFTTSYFAGFMPYPTEHSSTLDPLNSYVVAAYVGYDDNKTMRRGRAKIYGSNGALPLWTDTLKAIITEKTFGENLDTYDLKVLSRKEWTLKFDKENSPLLVDLPRGIVLRGGGVSDFEVWDTTNLARTGETFTNEFALGRSVKSPVYLPSDYSSGTWQPLRMYQPYQVVFEEEDLLKKPLEEVSNIELNKDDLKYADEPVILRPQESSVATKEPNRDEIKDNEEVEVTSEKEAPQQNNGTSVEDFKEKDLW